MHKLRERRCQTSAVEGTRIQDAAVTRSILAPRLAEFGVTRVANVTGLDRLGIPVWMVIRPNSSSLSVSQGKGLTSDAAWVSGVMESVELHQAERIVKHTVFACAQDLSKSYPIADMSRIPMRPHTPYHEEFRKLWIQGSDLISDGPVYVPFGLVHVNAVMPFPPGDECFRVTSNGLASGMTLQEAVVHGLCEVIERDAVTLWREQGERHQIESLINPDSVGSAKIRGLLNQCREAGFEVLAYNSTSSIGLPVVTCVILDSFEPTDTLRAASMGYGCHLKRDVAFIRALTEAAQSRLTLIAGSRDDLERVDYESKRRHFFGIERHRQLVGASHKTPFEALPDFSSNELGDQVGYLLDRLQSMGMDHVICVDLSSRNAPPHVMRVIVPGLREPHHAH